VPSGVSTANCGPVRPPSTVRKNGSQGADTPPRSSVAKCKRARGMLCGVRCRCQVCPASGECQTMLPGLPVSQTFSPRQQTVRKSKASRIPSARGDGGACQTNPAFSVRRTSPPSPTSSRSDPGRSATPYNPRVPRRSKRGVTILPSTASRPAVADSDENASVGTEEVCRQPAWGGLARHSSATCGHRRVWHTRRWVQGRLPRRRQYPSRGRKT